MASSCHGQVGADLVHLYESKTFADFTIISNDGIEFRVHRQILAARSEVFLRMLSTEGSREVLTGRCEVADVDGRTMDLLLRNLYGSFVIDADLTVEAVHKLLVAADKYAILNLGSAYGTFLKETLTEDDAAVVLVLADRFKVPDLKTATLDYIAKHRREFFAAGHLETLRSHSVDLVQDVVRSVLNKEQQMYCCTYCGSIGSVHSCPHSSNYLVTDRLNE